MEATARPEAQVIRSRTLRGAAARSVAFVCAVASLCSFHLPALAAEPAYSFRNPFHPEQCDRAVVFADRLLARDPASKRGRLIRAEGLLCKGLDDDPWALDEAFALLRLLAADEPHNFFVRLELADAERKRFPLSDEAESSLRQTEALLRSAEVGAARRELEAHVSENQAAMERRAARILPLVDERWTQYTAGTLTAAGMAQLVSLLVLLGPGGVDDAERSLDGFLATYPDAALATVYRGEVLWARGALRESEAVYRNAERLLCGSGQVKLSHDCLLARGRLQHLGRLDGKRPHGELSVGHRHERRTTMKHIRPP